MGSIGYKPPLIISGLLHSTGQLSWTIFFTMGSLFREGKFTEAAELIQQCLQENENDPKAWNVLGVICYKSGQYEDAGTCFENALVCDPDNPVYLRNLEKNRKKHSPNNSLVDSARNREAQSRSHNLVSSLSVSDPRMVYAGVIIGVLVIAGILFMGLSGNFTNSGASHLNASPDTTAVAVSTPVASPLPDLTAEPASEAVNTSEMKITVASLFDQGKYQEAIVLIDELLKVEPDNPGFWITKGIAQYRLHQYQYAVHSFDQALLIDPNSTEAQVNKKLALVYIETPTSTSTPTPSKPEVKPLQSGEKPPGDVGGGGPETPGDKGPGQKPDQ